jgi:secondary thiamine-phosphate synthase enzyme
MSAMKMFNASFTLPSGEGTEVSDITSLVRDAVQRSLVTTGIALINTPHTTCAVFINEFETALIDDLTGLVERLVPECGCYPHDGPRYSDGRHEHTHARLRATLLGQSVAVGVTNGELTLGGLQVIFAELGDRQMREIHVQLVGE